jgi:hypothetical protein
MRSAALGRFSRNLIGQLLVNAVVSMGQRNTQLEPTLH